MKVILAILIISLIVIEVCAKDGAETEERKKKKGCTNPKGKKGKTYMRGCDKFTCIENPRRTFNWIPEFEPSKCCSFNGTAHRIGSNLISKLLPDMCTRVKLMCYKNEAKADMEIVVENGCPVRPGIMNVLTNTSNTITSPRFPSSYPVDVDECWMRTPSCGHHVQLEFTDFEVLGDDDYITIDPPVNGQSKFYGNSFKSAKAPPEIINFPADYAVRLCFNTGLIVHGHPGFRVEMTEKRASAWISSPNYPEDINEDNYMDPPPRKYGSMINQCWVRSPYPGNSLDLQFFAFDVHSPPSSLGDWLTIQPRPTSKPMSKYYGSDLTEAEAPPTYTTFAQDTIITVCFKTRDRVDDHNGFLAEVFGDTGSMGPSTYGYSTDYSTDYYDYSTQGFLNTPPCLQNKKYVGRVLEVIQNVSDYRSCRADCQAPSSIAQCNYWSYDKGSKDCHLFSSVSRTISKSGWMSGKFDCTG